MCKRQQKAQSDHAVIPWVGIFRLDFPPPSLPLSLLRNHRSHVKATFFSACKFHHILIWTLALCLMSTSMPFMFPKQEMMKHFASGLSMSMAPRHFPWPFDFLPSSDSISDRKLSLFHIDHQRSTLLCLFSFLGSRFHLGMHRA